jgi:hypothetical protein
LPEPVKPGPYDVKALNGHGGFAAQRTDSTSVKTLVFLWFWIFMRRWQIDNSQLPGLPPVV